MLLNLDLHKMSTSMYEVFNWGHVNESRPKRLSLFAGASEINIDDPPPVRTTTTTTTTYKPTHSRPHGERQIIFSTRNQSKQKNSFFLKNITTSTK